MNTPVTDWPLTNTPHGMMLAFDEFRVQHGLVDRLQHIPIDQKTRTYAPQTKLADFPAKSGPVEALPEEAR